MFVIIPANIAINIDVITLYIVNIHPNIPNVAKIESTPVIGVEMRKDSVAPLLAPLFFILLARGITPQEQTGRGIPKIVDFITEEILSFPRCFVTMESGTSSCKMPAKTSPKRMYGAIALLRSASALKKRINISILSLVR